MKFSLLSVATIFIALEVTRGIDSGVSPAYTASVITETQRIESDAAADLSGLDNPPPVNPPPVNPQPLELSITTRPSDTEIQMLMEMSDTPESDAALSAKYGLGLELGLKSPDHLSVETRRRRWELDYDYTIDENVPSTFTGYLRKLVGSNCVLIERGKVTPYYKCIGCDVRMAMGCVTDLRGNRSQNVDSTCTMGSMTEVYGGPGCCPRFKIDPTSGRGNLIFMGSAYPETLRCIHSVGCSSSSIYTQLYEECNAVCPPALYVDQNNGPVCYADYNAAISLRVTYTVVLAVSSLVLLFSFDFF